MGRAPLLCPPTSDIKLVPQFGLPRQSPLRAHKRPFRRYRQSRKYEVTSARVQAVKRRLLKSIAFEDLGARVDAPAVPHDQLPVLRLQERSSDLTRPDDEVPQAIKLLNDDVHLSVPRRTCIPASTRFIATVLRFTPRSSDLDHRFRNATPRGRRAAYGAVPRGRVTTGDGGGPDAAGRRRAHTH